jgi:hypothetical protein
MYFDDRFYLFHNYHDWKRSKEVHHFTLGQATGQRDCAKKVRPRDGALQGFPTAAASRHGTRWRYFISGLCHSLVFWTSSFQFEGRLTGFVTKWAAP